MNYIYPYGTSCPIDVLHRVPPMPPKDMVKLPQKKEYTREDFYKDILAAKTKGQKIEAMHKALTASRYYSRMPVDVRKAILKSIN